MELSDTKKKIIQALFPNPLSSKEEIEKMYPPRTLKEGAMVTRIAPSPTGAMHIGGLYAAFISERLAHQSNGIFYLRIDDTDKKRELEGAEDLITTSLARYRIVTDEGLQLSGEEIGLYGPYRQSKRENIYKTYMQSLLERGCAYPCFCTLEKLDEMRTQQDLAHIRSGYYGSWAHCRNRSDDEVLQLLQSDTPFVIRFKSNGNFEKKIILNDLLKGVREFPENDQDIVIMKADGLPTYHFAHVIDDHLMGTTHVLRGDEWLASVALHVQLFEAMGWTPPFYSHLMSIQKIDGKSRRKLSKRSDPEATISYYDERGYPETSVRDYLLNLASSDFDEWRKSHPRADNREFLLTFEKLSQSSGPLLDLVKLEYTSKETIARMTAQEVYDASYSWAKTHDSELAQIIESEEEYTKKIFSIERHEDSKIRKDIAMWSQVRQEIWYFFDSKFELDFSQIQQLLNGIDMNDAKALVRNFLQIFHGDDSKDVWLEKIKELCTTHGFAGSIKNYKQEPEKYKGTIVDVTRVFRVLLTGKKDTPDLYELMQVMGQERVNARLSVLATL